MCNTSIFQVLTKHLVVLLQVIPLTVTQLFPRVTLSATSFAFGKVHPSNPKSLQLTITNPSTVTAQWSIEVMEVLPTDGSSEQQQGGMLSASGMAANSRSKTPAGSSMLPPVRGAASSSGGSTVNTPRQPATSMADGAVGRTARSTKAEVSGGATSSTAAPPCVFSVSEASGSLPGRGLGMPYKHTVSVTFSPSSGVQSWQGLLKVAVKGGPGVEVQLTGAGDLKEPLPGLPNIKGF